MIFKILSRLWQWHKVALIGIAPIHHTQLGTKKPQLEECTKNHHIVKMPKFITSFFALENNLGKE